MTDEEEDTSFHFTMFASFHEAAMTFSGGDMQVYGRLMYLINVYGITASMPDCELSAMEQGFMTLIKPIIDASLKKQKILKANGSKGGRPKTTEKKPTEKPKKNVGFNAESKENQSENQKKFLVISDMDMERDKDMDTDMDSACVCEDKSPFRDDKSSLFNVAEDKVQDYGALQRDVYDFVCLHNEVSPPEKKIPVSNSLVAFSQREMRELLDVMRGQSTDTIRDTVRNYIGVAESDTWKKMFSWGDFLKNNMQYTPEFFDKKRFELNTKTQGEDQSPAEKFYGRMKNNPAFDLMLFTTHQKEWADSGMPEGDNYLALQDKWRTENAS